MDKDRLVGSAKQIKGTVKQVIGKAVGDAKRTAVRPTLPVLQTVCPTFASDGRVISQRPLEPNNSIVQHKDSNDPEHASEADKRALGTWTTRRKIVIDRHGSS